MTPSHPYAGLPIALATMHGKDAAIEPEFSRALGMRVVVPAGLDTDALGTFTGEVERPAGPRETAMLKARLGMRASGVARGLASEGSFGPDPVLGIVPTALELLVFVDDEMGIEVVETRLGCHTNYAQTTVRAGESVPQAYLDRAGFPDHALVVRPDGLPACGNTVKGIRSAAALQGAVVRAVRSSPETTARIETDMRADRNPTRMCELGQLARSLAARLLVTCPSCDAPGHGVVERRPGLPCDACGAPTARIAYEIVGCGRCGELSEQPRGDGIDVADPGDCQRCNP